MLLDAPCLVLLCGTCLRCGVVPQTSASWLLNVSRSWRRYSRETPLSTNAPSASSCTRLCWSASCSWGDAGLIVPAPPRILQCSWATWSFLLLQAACVADAGFRVFCGNTQGWPKTSRILFGYRPWTIARRLLGFSPPRGRRSTCSPLCWTQRRTSEWDSAA